MLDSWLTSYNLKERLRVPPDQSDAILGDLNVCIESSFRKSGLISLLVNN